MKRLLFLLAIAMPLCAATKSITKAAPKPLPVLGTQFHSLPEGAGKAQVEAACLRCHSADMLVQQRLTEKQWTAGVEKMMRWGAAVADPDKAAIIAYLTKNFGTANTSFAPVKTKPVGR